MKWFYLIFAITAMLTAARYGENAARVPDGTGAGAARQASDIKIIESLVAFGVWEYARRHPIGRAR